MATWALVLLLCGALLGTVHSQISVSRRLIRNRHTFIADKGFIASFAHDCIDNSNKFNVEVKETPSIETLINLVERLEDVVANTSDLAQFNSPDKVARIILQRFHMDSVDFHTVEQDPHVMNAAQIDSQIYAKLDGVDDYYFPDYVYTNNELCTMLFMFSHFFVNNTRDASRLKRAAATTFQFQRANTATGTGTNQAVQSPYLDAGSDVYPLQEKGIVSLRQDKNEAIAPAKVFMGIIAGLNNNPVLSGSQIVNKLGSTLKEESNLKDGVMAVTFGNLMGTASFFELKNEQIIDQSLIYGVKGTWKNETCCTYYETQQVSSRYRLKKSNRGSLAQIRGALDGFIIGNNFRNVDLSQVRLSQILKSYYSMPHMSTSGNKLGISYCDRRDNKPNTATLNEVGQSYNAIYNNLYGKVGSTYKGDQLVAVLDQAAATQEFCTSKRPSGNFDNNSPCETPSDLIFVVDPKTEELTNTAQLVSNVISKISKIDRYGGTVSVFVNTAQRTNVELPAGTWPFGALIFNSTNTGSVVCQFAPQATMTGQTNLGKYLMSVNQTIFNYKWWTPRKVYAGVPSKNVILIDYGTLVLATSGTDRDDYYTYKDALKWRNRDVYYGVVSPNKDLFKDFVREEADIVAPVSGGSSAQLATAFEKKICENPATLTYNECFTKASQNFTHEGYVTPGYKQNWAMYPEYFKASSDIEFKIKAVEGSIRYCWDRVFPPNRQDYCKDLTENGEDSFKIWGPCNGHSVHTCEPVYVTVWGKDRTTPCKDVGCLSQDQVKFSIGHTGAYCSSALKLGSVLLLQVICLVLVYMRNFKSQ